jgi:hypothetical protein
MATFPAAAKLGFAGYAKRRQSAVLRSEMESGPPKQARILSKVLVQRDLTYHFDSASDYNAFIVWFRDDITRGADWFDWTDPEDSTVKSARIVGGTLTEETSLNPALIYWQIKLTLETWDG